MPYRLEDRAVDIHTTYKAAMALPACLNKVTLFHQELCTLIVHKITIKDGHQLYA